MNSWYHKWLHEEKNWIAQYQKKIIWKSCFQIIPAVLIILVALFGGLAYIDEEDVYSGIASGLYLGGMISIPYLGGVILFLRPGRYVRKIKSAVRKMKLDEKEKEELGHEMLEAGISTWRSLSFVYDGHGSKCTPARFRVTPNYVLLVGGYPYANILRMDDTIEVKAEEEEKTVTIHRSKSVLYETFILYTIVFYQKDSSQNGSVPIKAMGFYSEEIRDKALDMIHESQKNRAYNL